jgi:hypothetical protein
MAKCKKLNLFMDSVVYALLLLSDGRSSEPVLLNVYEAPELIPRNEFRQPM